MKKIILTLLISLSSLALSPGDEAPLFELINQDNQKISLKDLRGKKVILEWFNDGCPFVRKHYDSANMQMTQDEATKNGYVWLTVNSSNVGKQGHLASSKEAKEKLLQEKSKANHLLLDTAGDVGRLYNAKTTPEIFMISENGKIEYMGAIDSIASADQGDIKKANNYVLSAISDLKSGRAVQVSKSKPYGCSVKY